MVEITAKVMARCFPTLKSDKVEEYLPLLTSATAEGQINTLLRSAAFLAQVGHESCDLKFFEELASGEAYDIVNNPRLAAKLGNTQAGDGRRFKGRGPIQITGRANYQKASDNLGLDLVNHPELAAVPRVGFRTAVWYWTLHNLNRFADLRDFDSITVAINGGFNGKVDRDLRYRWALDALAPSL